MSGWVEKVAEYLTNSDFVSAVLVNNDATSVEKVAEYLTNSDRERISIGISSESRSVEKVAEYLTNSDYSCREYLPCYSL